MFGVGLCCLRALRGLCGFCARVELGGLKTCSVFAFVFLSFPLCLPFVFCSSSGCLVLVILLVLSICVVLVALCGCVVVSFSLTDYTQKERAQRFCSLRPLLSCCGLPYLVAALYSLYSSGVSPLIS